YAWIGGRAVPLAESKDIAKRKRSILTGKKAIEDALPPEQRALAKMRPELDRPLLEHLADYKRYLETKNNSPGYVNKAFTRIKAVLAGCAVETWGQLDADDILFWLKEQRDKDDRSTRYGFGVSTTNHYLTAIKGFSKWMCDCRPPRAPSNP